jgi:hypothetical protein
MGVHVLLMSTARGSGTAVNSTMKQDLHEDALGRCRLSKRLFTQYAPVEANFAYEGV